MCGWQNLLTINPVFHAGFLAIHVQARPTHLVAHAHSASEPLYHSVYAQKGVLASSFGLQVLNKNKKALVYIFGRCSNNKKNCGHSPGAHSGLMEPTLIPTYYAKRLPYGRGRGRGRGWRGRGEKLSGVQ
jgi:hypothetical protein